MSNFLNKLGKFGGAAIGALGSLGSSLIGNKGSKNAQKQANKDNIAFWNLQNEYNNPSAQMQRLRDAGLNPNLVYGGSSGSSAGNAGAISPSKAAPYNVDNPLNDINTVANTQQTSAQTDNLKAQNTVLTQEAILKAAQTGKTLSEGASASTKAQVDKALLDTSVNASKENLRSLEQGTIGKELDNSFKSGAIKSQLKKIFYEAENAKKNLTGTELSNTIKELDIELKKLGIEKGDPWYFRIMGRNLKDTKNKANKMLNNWKIPKN